MYEYSFILSISFHSDEESHSNNDKSSSDIEDANDESDDGIVFQSSSNGQLQTNQNSVAIQSIVRPIGAKITELATSSPKHLVPYDRNVIRSHSTECRITESKSLRLQQKRQRYLRRSVSENGMSTSAASDEDSYHQHENEDYRPMYGESIFIQVKLS